MNFLHGGFSLVSKGYSKCWRILHQGDPRANDLQRMSVRNIITDAMADTRFWPRCKQVLRFAEQKAGLTQNDLEYTDWFLRHDRRDIGHGSKADKEATDVEKLVKYATMVYNDSPDKMQKACSLFRVLSCFSTRRKPLLPDLPVDQVVM